MDLGKPLLELIDFILFDLIVSLKTNHWFLDRNAFSSLCLKLSSELFKLSLVEVALTVHLSNSLLKLSLSSASLLDYCFCFLILGSSSLFSFFHFFVLSLSVFYSTRYGIVFSKSDSSLSFHLISEPLHFFFRKLILLLSSYDSVVVMPGLLDLCCKLLLEFL